MTDSSAGVGKMEMEMDRGKGSKPEGGGEVEIWALLRHIGYSVKASTFGEPTLLPGSGEGRHLPTCPTLEGTREPTHTEDLCPKRHSTFVTARTSNDFAEFSLGVGTV